MIFETYHYKKNRIASARQNPLCTLKGKGGRVSMSISTGNRSIDGWITKEFIRKATHPHPCPLPSKERGLKNRPSLEGRG
jgi:hypothetical protein